MPLTAMEALTAGTPVVGFNIGGMKDIISEPHSGYLARPQDTDDLALGITKVLASRDHDQRREHVELPWLQGQVASQYMSIYTQI